jgi:hypothetical protein
VEQCLAVEHTAVEWHPVGLHHQPHLELPGLDGADNVQGTALADSQLHIGIRRVELCKNGTQNVARRSVDRTDSHLALAKPEVVVDLRPERRLGLEDCPNVRSTSSPSLVSRTPLRSRSIISVAARQFTVQLCRRRPSN